MRLQTLRSLASAGVHLGLDLLFLVPGETGGRETYVRELLPALRSARPALRVTTFVNRETAAAGAGFWSEQADRTVVLPRVSARSRASWALGELEALARAASRAGVDVLHSPANFAPLHGPFARVLTLHDLIFRRLPQLTPPAVRLATEAMVVPAARRADRVVTVSEASRADIVGELGLAPERVVAVPNGIAPPPGDGDGARARTRLGLASERPLALAVATDVTHKNLAALVDGVARIPAAERPLLALAGHGTDAGPLAQRAAAAGAGDDVRALGAVSQRELEDLYAAAGVYVTATLYEGFGLPVLEALARGVPVVCSDLPVLREVAGDCAAAWLDPREPESIAAALRTALAAPPDPARGRARAATFTWSRAAAATADAFDAALTRARTAR